MKTRSYLLFALLSVTIVLNIILYFWGVYWKDAWVNQFVTTSDIERILIKTEGNLSFDHIKSISMSLYRTSFSEVDATVEQINNGADRRAIRINNTILLFENDFYNGSKSIREN